MLPEICRYFEAYVTAVSAEGLGKEDLALRFDAAFVAKLRSLRPSVSPMLEGCEGETFVAGAPFFSRALKVGGWEKQWDGSRGVAKITSLS